MKVPLILYLLERLNLHSFPDDSYRPLRLRGGYIAEGRSYRMGTTIEGPRQMEVPFLDSDSPSGD